MKTVILAAGSSTRLYPLTKDTPKCLLDVGGKTLLEHQLKALSLCNTPEVIIVTGYRAPMLHEKIEAVKHCYPFEFSFVHNERYATTNNLYSLWTARDKVKQGSDKGFVCLHADLLMHPDILRSAFQAPQDICLIADRAILEETMKLKADGARVTSVGKHVSMAEATGTFLGIARFSAVGSQAMFRAVDELIAHGETNVYFTRAIESLIAADFDIAVEYIEAVWTEIDVAAELVAAREQVYPLLAATLATRQTSG